MAAARVCDQITNGETTMSMKASAANLENRRAFATKTVLLLLLIRLREADVGLAVHRKSKVPRGSTSSTPQMETSIKSV